MKFILINREGTGINRQYVVNLPVVPRVGELLVRRDTFWRVDDVAYREDEVRLLVSADGSRSADRDWIR